jgi:hypothetical protein
MYGWGHNYDIVSDVDHLGLDSVGPLKIMIHSNIQGISIVLLVPQNNTNPTKKGVKGLDRSYGG